MSSSQLTEARDRVRSFGGYNSNTIPKANKTIPADACYINHTANNDVLIYHC
jgi:hypothetical protein